MARALLIVDMLNDFTRETGSLFVPDNPNIIPAVRREIDRAHREGEPVVYVCDAHIPDDPEFRHWPRHAVRGTDGAQVDEALAPAAGDKVLRKRTYSLFYKTALNRTLRALGVDVVRLTGCVTNICILYAAMEAPIQGYGVEVVRDGVAGLDPEDHKCALRQMENVFAAKML
jgi:nicotinamidase-related amidase